MKNIGKPCAGKLYARFDEGGQATPCPLLYLLLLVGDHPEMRRIFDDFRTHTVDINGRFNSKDGVGAARKELLIFS